MKKGLKTYWVLFSSMFYLCSFTFGGGYVIVPLMQKRFVDNLHWIEENEMYDLIAISQSSPGSIAINISISIGYKIAGFKGAAATVLGSLLPSFIIIGLLTVLYSLFKGNEIIAVVLRGMQAGVAAVITYVIITMGHGIIKEKRAVSIIIMAMAFIATFFLHINVFLIILSCIAIGIISTLLSKNKQNGDKT